MSKIGVRFTSHRKIGVRFISHRKIEVRFTFSPEHVNLAPIVARAACVHPSLKHSSVPTIQPVE